MKAALLEGPNKLLVKEIKKPLCPQKGLLLRVKSCGLCGSDIRTIRNGSKKIKKYPVIMGHEITGVVEESECDKFPVGTNIAVGSTAPCGNCYFCDKGLENLCSNMIHLGNGPVHCNGGFAEYLAIPLEFIEHGPVMSISPNANFDQLALAEPLTTVMNSHEKLKLSPTDTAVVIGAGPIGALHVALLKLEGIATTIMADIFDERLSLASKAAKPDLIINNSKQSLKEEVMKVTAGRGADLVIVACSVKAVQEQSFELVRKGGHIIFFGGLPERSRMVQIDSNVLHYSQLSLHGTYLSCPRHFFKAVNIISDKKIDASKFITKIPLEEINAGIELAESGKALKVVTNP